MMTPEEDPSYLKVDEAARFLRVTPRTVYRNIWNGKIPASKVGGLYYIKLEVLEDMLEQGQVTPSQKTETRASLDKCGNCYRLLDSERQIGATCQADGCTRLLCSECTGKGIHYCSVHAPSKEEQLGEAVQRRQRGELPALVTESAARLRELNFINRSQARIASITTLVHPASGEVLTISDWDAILEQTDDRAEVMRRLDKIMLDTNTLARVPLNAEVRYLVPKQKNQKGPQLEIIIKVLSRLPKMLRDGFDTQPLGADDLTPWLVSLSEEAQRGQTYRLVVLASTTGWDASARQVILGEQRGRQEVAGSAFAHRMALFFLFDLEEGELLYNPLDDRARRYAELFAALLPSEELDEISKAIEAELVVYESLTLQHAVKVLPFTEAQLEKAFTHLAETGRYLITQVPELGKVLVRR